MSDDEAIAEASAKIEASAALIELSQERNLYYTTELNELYHDRKWLLSLANKIIELAGEPRLRREAFRNAVDKFNEEIKLIAACTLTDENGEPKGE